MKEVLKKAMDAYEKSKADVEADKVSKYKEGSKEEEKEDEEEAEETAEGEDKSLTGKMAKGIKKAIHGKLSTKSSSDGKGGKPNMVGLAKKLAKRKMTIKK